MEMTDGWEFDAEWNWTWWTIGVRYRNQPYDAIVWLVGIGPLLLVFTKPMR